MGLESLSAPLTWSVPCESVIGLLALTLCTAAVVFCAWVTPAPLFNVPITTSSADSGSAPVLQLPGVSQSPPAALVQVIVASSMRSSSGSSIKRDQPLADRGRLRLRDLVRRPIGFRSHNGNFMTDLLPRRGPRSNESAIPGARKTSAGATTGR